MTDEHRISPRLGEDLQFEVVDGPADYAESTDKPVAWVEVANDEHVLGYLWGCDADDAADWEDRPAAGDDASNAGTYWIAKLRAAKARGLTPSQALTELTADAGSRRAGRVVPGSASTANSHASLRELATRG